MTAISYHDTVNDLQGLDWSAEGPFARPEWFGLLEQSGIRPLLVMAKGDESATALPLQYADGHIAALTNWYAFTWSELRTSGLADNTLLADIAADLKNRTSRIVLDKLPEDDGTLARAEEAFREAGWIVLRSPCDTNHILPVNGRRYAEFLAQRPGPLRTTLKRKAKNVDIRLATKFSPADWSAYEDIYADSWKPAEGDPELLRRFAEQESAAGRFRFGLALHEGNPVAAQFWTVEGRIAYIHKLAHRESAKSLSPGTTLTAAMFERVIDTDKVELVDFGTGDDPYKRDWMEVVRVRWRLTCLRGSSPRNWPILAKALLRKLVRR